MVAATELSLRVGSPKGGAKVPVTAGYFRWVQGAAAHTLVKEGREKGIVVEFELE